MQNKSLRNFTSSSLLRSFKAYRYFLMVPALAGLAAPQAQANTATWAGTTSGNWATTTNWSGGAGTGGAPAPSGDSLVFTSATGAGGTTITDNLMTPGTYTIAGITFNSGAAAFTINPGTSGTNGFTLTTGITNSSTNLQTINDLVALSGANTFTMTSGGGNIAVGGVVSGSGALTTAGTGTLALSAVNTYSGATTIGANTTLAITGSGQLGSGSYSNSISDAGVLAYQSTANQTLSGAISGSGTLNVNAGAVTTGTYTTGTLTLSGANTSFTGALAANSGVLTLTGSVGSTATLAMGGGTFNYSTAGTNSQSFASTTINGGGLSNINVTVAGDTLNLGTLSQTAGSGGSVNFSSGTGTITTTTGNTNGILGGWATLGNSGAAGATATWAANSNGTGLGNVVAYSGYTSLSGSGSTSYSNAQLSSTANYLTGISTGNSVGTNYVTQFTGTTSTSTVTINSLTVQGDTSIASGLTLSLGSGGLVLNGISRWLLDNNSGSTGGSGQLTSGLASGELFIDVSDATSDANNWRIWDSIVNNGSTPTIVVKNGPGFVDLMNANTFTGGVIINGGTLAFDSGGNSSSTGTVSGPITVNTGGIFQMNAGLVNGTNGGRVYTQNSNITLNGGAIWGSDGYMHLGASSNTITIASNGGYLGSTYTGSSGSENKGIFVDGIVTGSGNLIIEQAGLGGNGANAERSSNNNETGNSYNSSIVMFTNSANTYSGTITVEPYTAGSGAGSYLGANANTALQYATVNLNGNNTGGQAFGASPLLLQSGLTTNNFTLGALEGSGNVALSTYNEATQSANVATATLTVGNGAAGAANLTYSGVMSGGGSLIWAGTGTWSLTGVNTYSGATTISSGGLTIGGAGQLGSGSYAGAITDNGVLTMNSTAAQTLSGIISGTGAFVQSGTGTTTLTNNNTFTGNVVINAGTVNSDDNFNTANPAYSALGNPQTAARTITINNGGTLLFSLGNQLGNTASTPNVGVIVNQGGTFKVNVTGASGTNGGDGNTVGSLTLNGGSVLTGNGYSNLFEALVLNGNVTVGGSAASSISSLLGTPNASSGVMLGLNSTSTVTFNVASTGTTGVPDLVISDALTPFQGSTTGGNLIKSGAGTMALNGANTYTGSTSVNAGKLLVNGSIAGTSTLTVANGAALGGTGTITSPVVVNGAASGGGGGIVLANTLATDTLTLKGGLTLGGASSGLASNLNLEVGATSADDLAITGALTVNVGGGLLTINNVGLLSNQTYTLATFSGAGTYNGGAFTTGTATSLDGFTLTNTTLGFGITGQLAVTAGSNGALELVTTGATTPTTAYWKGTYGTAWTGTGVLGGNFTTDAAGTQYVGAYPAGTTTVYIGATGESNQNSMTLGQNFNILGLNFLNVDASSTAVGAATIGGTNTLTLGAGGINDQNTQAVTLNMAGVVLNGSQTWTNSASGALNVSAAVTGAAPSGSNTLTLANTGSGTTTISGVISDGILGGKQAIQVSDTNGVTLLSGANTYTGTTTVSTGTLEAGVASVANTSGAFGLNSAVNIANTAGATLALNGFNEQVGSLNGGGSTGGTVALGANTLTFDAGNSSGTYTGVFTGSGTLTKAGTGTQVLNGASGAGYTGAVADTAGALNLQSNSALGSTSGVTVTSGAALQLQGGISTSTPVVLNGTGLTDGALENVSGTNSDSGSITLASNATIGVDSGTLNLSGPISGTSSTLTLASTGTAVGNISSGMALGTGGLTVNGGTWTLSSTNSYTGASVVNSGATLILTGSNTVATSALTLNGGGTLVLQANAGNTSTGTSTALSTASNGLALSGGTVDLLSNSSVTFAGTNGGYASLGGGVTFDVDPVTSGAGQTITFAPTGLSTGNNSSTISVTSSNGDTLALGNINVNANQSLTLNPTTANLILNGVGNSVHFLTKNGQGNLDITGAVSSSFYNTGFGLNLVINQGLMQFGTGSSLSPVGSNLAVTLAIGTATLELGDASNPINLSFTSISSSSSTAGIIGGNSATSTLTLNDEGQSGNNNTFGGVIGGSATNANNIALVKSGSNTLTLTGANTYVGSTTINAGTLVIGNGTSGSLSNSSTTTVATGSATLAFDEANNSTQSNSIANAGTVVGAETIGITNTLSGNITGAGNFIQSGAGQTILTGNDGYTGTTTVSSGTLQVGNGTNGSIGGTTAITVASGATLAFNEASGSTVVGSITNNGSVFGAESAAVTNTLTGIISGGGGFTQSGAGETVLTGANTYTGTTTVSSGTLALGSGGSIYTGSGSPQNSLTPGGSVIVNGVFDISQSGSQSIGDLSGTGTVNLGSGNLELADATSTTFSGAINDGGIGGGTGGSLTIDGGQTVTLSGSSSFTGQTAIQNLSTVDYASSAAFAQTSAIVEQTGSSIQLLGGIAGGSKSVTIAGTGNNGALENVSGSNSLAGQVILSSSATIMTDSASALALSGGVSESTRTLTVKGSGTTTIGAITGTTGGLTVNASGGLVDLTGANTYNGATTITAGSMELGNGGTSGSLSTSSTITDNGKFIVDRSNSVTQGTDFSASAISGSGSFQQLGSGTTTLTAANTYHGATTVSAGGLIVSNGTNGSATGSGALTVSAGALLGGAGQINASSFTIGGSGLLTKVVVGDGTDTTSQLNLAGTNANTITNTQLTFNISATNLGQANLLNVGASNITFSNTTLSLNIQGLAWIPSFTPYLLIQGTGTSQYTGLTTTLETIHGTQYQVITDPSALQLAFGQAYAATAYAPSVLILNTNGGADDIEVLVVPEPSTWAMILGGLGLLILWQRRKQNKNR